MAHPIQSKISERERRLSEIDAEVASLRNEADRLGIEISVYKDALRYVEPRGGREPRARSIDSGDSRGISDMWSALLRTVAGDTGRDEYDIDFILLAAETLGSHMTRGNARAQMANFVNRGIAERVTAGRFRLTDAGLRAVSVLNTDSVPESLERKTASDATEAVSIEAATSMFD